MGEIRGVRRRDARATAAQSRTNPKNSPLSPPPCENPTRGTHRTVKRPVIFDCRVDKHANCFPMIPSGEAHNHMLMGDDLTEQDIENAITEEGKVMV